METADVPAVVALQRDAFPPPFDEDLLWRAEHLHRHLEVFPDGQFVAEIDGRIVGSCSNTRIENSVWDAHGNWNETVGGPMLERFAVSGDTLYGLDVSVHPEFRRRGIGRAFYAQRFGFVQARALFRYGTACRLPDFRASGVVDVRDYAEQVAAGHRPDRTLTPLLRYGLHYLGVIRDYMDDAESGNAAAMLEWTP